MAVESLHLDTLDPRQAQASHFVATSISSGIRGFRGPSTASEAALARRRHLEASES